MPGPRTDSRTVVLEADLRFSVEVPGRAPVRGTVTGTENRLEVRLSDPATFAGGRDARHLRALAAALAAQGITVVVVAGGVVLLELGITDPPWWQRRVSRSRHLHVVSLRGALTGVVGRVRGSGSAAVLPGADLLPPATLFPIAPTFATQERRITTTHDPRRAGNPRLVLSIANPHLPDDGRVVFPLLGERTTIGSGPDCDIRLDGLEQVHAVVVHDERDELVLHDVSGTGTTAINGAAPTAGRPLRTGARVTVGGWTLVYRRAEYADHGRPFGGRIGGEAGRQRPQSRPRSVGGPPGPTVVLGPRGPR